MTCSLLSEFEKLGCTSKRNAAIAQQVYLELCEVKKYWDVEYFYESELENMYLTAKRSKSEPTSVFIPIAVSDDISFSRMRKYSLLSRSQRKSVYLAIVEADSTCVYYKISNEICEPPLEVSVTNRDEKRQRLDDELRKNRKLLEDAAMCATPITLSKVKESDSIKNLNKI